MAFTFSMYFNCGHMYKKYVYSEIDRATKALLISCDMFSQLFQVSGTRACAHR